MPIFHKLYDFTIAASNAVERFPKKDRHTVGMRIQTTTLDLIISLLRANEEYGVKRQIILKEMSIFLDLLKILIRLAKDTRAMPEKQYIHLQEKLQEIGRMLGGWIKSLQTKNPA